MTPVLETENLILRGQKRGDFDAYAAFWTSDRSARFGFGGPHERKRAWEIFLSETGQWQINGFGMWVAEEKASAKTCGWVGFYHPDHYDETELGWTVLPEFEGLGVAYEASLAARAHGAAHFDIKSPASFIAVDNARSIRLAERLNATREDTRDHGFGAFHVYRHPEVTQ